MEIIVCFCNELQLGNFAMQDPAPSRNHAQSRTTGTSRSWRRAACPARHLAHGHRGGRCGARNCAIKYVVALLLRASRAASCFPASQLSLGPCCWPAGRPLNHAPDVPTRAPCRAARSPCFWVLPSRSRQTRPRPADKNVPPAYCFALAYGAALFFLLSTA